MNIQLRNQNLSKASFPQFKGLNEEKRENIREALQNVRQGVKDTKVWLPNLKASTEQVNSSIRSTVGHGGSHGRDNGGLGAVISKHQVEGGLKKIQNNLDWIQEELDET